MSDMAISVNGLAADKVEIVCRASSLDNMTELEVRPDSLEHRFDEARHRLRGAGRQRDGAPGAALQAAGQRAWFRTDVGVNGVVAARLWQYGLLLRSGDEPCVSRGRDVRLLWIVFRIGGRRTLAEITTFDFILLLIIGDATQQALVGDDFSITTAALVIVTLVLLDLLMGRLAITSAAPCAASSTARRSSWSTTASR